MGMSSHKKVMREIDREEDRTKKMKQEKIEKKLKKAFKKLNNKNVYAFLTDKDNTSYQNFQDFLSLLEKLCEKTYGKAKKYGKVKVSDILHSLFPEPTKRQIKTFNKLNKTLKKTEDMNLLGFKMNGLFKGKAFDRSLEKHEKEVSNF